MTNWKDWLVIIVGIIVCLLILLSIAESVITLTITDIDCWLATDPIVCQKLKDGVK